ncbi:MAG: PQQ-binding-like beta-propeller repeat protein [Kofleriaceae bacterium]|nr:PQQ-binding-like beta-propeller repeat protein [Kofleriaceae bacterium]
MRNPIQIVSTLVNPTPRFILGIVAGLAISVSSIGASACGGTSGFGLSAGDNDPEKLVAAFATVTAPQPGPVNKLGKPMVFLAARGKPKQLIAFDLEGKSELWRVDADVSSKVIVGRDFVAFRQGEKMFVAKDIATGADLWSMAIDGTFVGASSDGANAYITIKESSREWTLYSINGQTGAEQWSVEAPGVMGAPAARGGLVFSPFMKQWLMVMSAVDGKVLTRIRGIDEEISFVRTTPNEVYFGSKAGVFLLDEKAASGKRSQSTYGTAKIPEGFGRAHYHWDAFDPIQAGYSAYDRNRILWTASAQEDGFAFANNLAVVQAYRFFFAFDTNSGDLKWAFNHPRVDIIASSSLGSTIGIASMSGGIGALNPVTGEQSYQAQIKGQFTGGTFDAAGWSPSEKIGDSGSTAAALASIARDRDARFNDIKKFAVTALSQLKGSGVTKDLLTLIQNDKTPPYLLKTTGDVLIERKDASGLIHLVTALQSGNDYVEGSKARAVGIIAQAMAGIDPNGIDAGLRGQAVDALLAHLHDPVTTMVDLPHIVNAIGRFSAEKTTSGQALQALQSFLLIYRSDPGFGTQISAISAIVDILLAHGGAKERAIVSFVAEDPATLPTVAAYAQSALVKRPAKTDSKETAKGKGADDGATKGTDNKKSKSGPKRAIKTAKPVRGVQKSVQ